MMIGWNNWSLKHWTTGHSNPLWQLSQLPFLWFNGIRNRNCNPANLKQLLRKEVHLPSLCGLSGRQSLDSVAFPGMSISWTCHLKHTGSEETLIIVIAKVVQKKPSWKKHCRKIPPVLRGPIILWLALHFGIFETHDMYSVWTKY